VDAAEREFVRSQLPKVPLFFGVRAETLANISGLVRVYKATEGQDLLALGVVPSRFCILTHGSIAVVLGNGLCVARLSAAPTDPTLRNPFFGEMGLLSNKPSVAAVR